FVEYGNGADSTGAGGSSTIIQYDNAGNIEHTYTIAGSVDGLKYNPYTGQIWALQNQDGNSTLSLIDPVTHKVTGPLSYANPSATSGYDDVVFEGNKVFLSYTNPNGAGDPTLVELVNGDRPSDLLLTSTILTDGAKGLDTATGQVEVVPQSDPDSLKMAPNGDLIFSSGNDGTIIDVQNPGKSNQAVSFTNIQGVTAGNAGLDDVIKPNATAGTFYLTDTNDNRVLAFHVTGLNVNDYYASVGSLGAFGQVDPTTGVFTPIVSAQNAPGFELSGPHGVTFVADLKARPVPLVDHIATLADGPAGSTGPDSITLGDGFVWVAYTNGIP